MSFDRPSLPTLIERTTADLVSRLGLTGTVLRRATVRVLARVYAGAVYMLHGHLDWAARQLHVSTADGDQLDAHGAEYGITRLPGAYAGGEIMLTGVADATAPAGTIWQRSDGVQYVQSADATIVAGSAAADVTCSTAGSEGNAEAGVVLTIVSPVVGIVSSATVASGGISGGADVESDASLRSRILARKRTPPQGGSRADYVAWALAVPGVTRVWVLPQYAGAGSVGVTFVRDNDADIIPDSSAVAAVYDNIAPLAPVTATVSVFAPTPVAIDFEIVLSPYTLAVQSSVVAELADLLRRVGEPGATIHLSQFSEAISQAVDERWHQLIAPAAALTLASDELPVLGSVVFVEPA